MSNNEIWSHAQVVWSNAQVKVSGKARSKSMHDMGGVEQSADSSILPGAVSSAHQSINQSV